MKRRTEAQWRGLIAAQRTSGQSISEYCRAEGLNPTYFSTKRQQLGQAKRQGQQKPPRFVPVQTLASKEDIILRMDGIQLGCSVSVSPQWIAALIQTLQGPH